ncbi:MAG: RNA-binding transcriptional accessory protein [Planctomycetes bacterium]|nr:RNA-binding transcriptional accessory protein [Planctomycetota bacterium]
MDRATASELDVVRVIAGEFSLPSGGVASVLKLLDDGSTVPFIARYRKEATGELDEVQIRAIQERAAYLKDLDLRRATVLKSIREQGKLTDALEAQIRGVTTKSALEDLYLPFRPKRRTRAIVARERGLEPLALRLLEQPASGDPKQEAAAFVNAEKGVADVDAALQGARDIVAEQVSENASLRKLTREHWVREAFLVSTRVESKTQQPTRFEAYYDFREPVAKIPSHRFLAVRRGEQEGALSVHLEADETRVLPKLESELKLNATSPFAGEFATAITDGYRRLLMPSIETELRIELKLRSDRLAVDVFADNLRHLLLSSPLGGKSVIGIDPGVRTGCKCVAVDATGKYLGATTIYPVRDQAKANAELAKFVLAHLPIAIAIGNGTHGRETEGFVRKLIAELAVEKPEVKSIIVTPVNEAGASVYSASDIARAEFPELDLTIRGAISIARRLQDPLAELVKIDPKSIGVGQYQHDVHQPMLAGKLDEVVESCVNHVGVELNTASAPLLARVAGIGNALAGKIVKHREEHGAFAGREQLRKVGGLGPKAFEQCAGFLRISGAAHPLDASGVHPERYELVEKMAKDVGADLKQLVGSVTLTAKIDPRRYVGGDVGEPTLRDILDELKKPGRDPRSQFEPPKFREDVTKLADLKPGMTLEGLVTNVTAFGAFVDIGVHQDGLVHVSQLADKFVAQPSDVVKVGDKLQVRVIEVDLERKRIALTARKEAPKDDQGRAAPGGAQGSAQGAMQGAGVGGGGGGGGGGRGRDGGRAEGGRDGGRSDGGRRDGAGRSEGRGGVGRGESGRGDGGRGAPRGGGGDDRGNRGGGDRDRGHAGPSEGDRREQRAPTRPKPVPLTPNDQNVRSGSNNPLADLLKDMFKKK